MENDLNILESSVNKMSMSNDQVESNSNNDDQSSSEDEVEQIDEFDQFLQRSFKTSEWVAKRLKLLASPTNTRELHKMMYDLSFYGFIPHYQLISKPIQQLLDIHFPENGRKTYIKFEWNLQHELSLRNLIGHIGRYQLASQAKLRNLHGEPFDAA